MQTNVVNGCKGINLLRAFPIAPAGTFDIHKGLKDWAMPADCHDFDSPDDPDFCIFSVLTVKSYVPSFTTKMMARADAIVSNPIPAGYLYPPGFAVPAPVFEPLNLKLMPAGYELGTGILNVPALVPEIPVADPGTPVPFTADLRDAIFAIKSKLGA